jgi:hypothetical protein
MQHRLGIVHDRAATVAYCAAMHASVAVTRCRLDTRGISVDLHIRRFTEGGQP